MTAPTPTAPALEPISDRDIAIVIEHLERQPQPVYSQRMIRALRELQERRATPPCAEKEGEAVAAAIQLSEACDAMWNDVARYHVDNRQTHTKAITSAQQRLARALSPTPQEKDQ